MEQFFDVGVSSGSNNTLTHSLSTAVITPGGKIFRWYPSNDWTPSGPGVGRTVEAIRPLPNSLALFPPWY